MRQRDSNEDRDAASAPRGPRRKPEESEPALLQLQRRAGNAVVGAVLADVAQGSRDDTGLPDEIKTLVEDRSGLSLDDVRVHYDSDRPTRFGASAMTQGSDIHVAPGEERHVGHEAWHVVQQKQGRVRPTRSLNGLALNDDPALEREAEVVGRGLAVPPLPLGDPGVHQRIVQRVLPTKEKYLEMVVTEGEKFPKQGDEDYDEADDQPKTWVPGWSVAIRAFIATKPKPSFLSERIDRADVGQVEAFLRQLTQHALLGDYPTLVRHTQMAVRWFEDIESKSGPAGLRTLKVLAGDGGVKLEGRPGFPKVTGNLKDLKPRPGEHRRHILAWHDLRKFMELAYSSKKLVVVDAIEKALQQPDGLAKEAIAEGRALIEKGKAHQQDNGERTLKLGLFVMNGNPRNLWRGRGKINVTINSAAIAMNKDLDRVTTYEGLKKLAAEWRDAESSPIVQRARDLAADVIDGGITERKEAGEVTWTPAKGKAPPQKKAASATKKGNKGKKGKNPPAPLPNPPKASEDPKAAQEFVAQMKRRVKDWIIVAFEQDVLGSTTGQTKAALDKRNALRQPIELMDAVVSGNVEIEAVGDQALTAAIGELMTYSK
jgi:hypothetical protein